MQAVNEIGVGRGDEVCRKGCPYIRQLANYEIVSDSWCSSVASSVQLKSCKQLVDLSTVLCVVAVAYSLKHSVNVCMNC